MKTPQSLIRSLILSIAFLSFCFVPAALLAATYYVDASAGLDSNTGLSDSAAWKTIAKVNSSHFSPGDQILFKSGEVWREQLTVPSSGTFGQPITFGFYGAGNKPIISGSNIILGWKSAGPNLWVKDNISNKPALLYFNNIKGSEKVSVQELSHENDWLCQNNSIYIYTSNNPDLAFQNPGIEAGQRDYCIRGGKSFIVIEGLRLDKSNKAALYCSSANNISLKNLTIQNNGNGDSYEDAAIRLGSTYSIIISGNTIYEVYGDGIFIYDSSNVNVINNTISNCYGSISDNIHLEKCNDYLISDNHLTQQKSDTPKGNIICEHGSYGIIENNNCAYGAAGINCRDDGSIIQYNIVHHHNINEGVAGLFIGGEDEEINNIIFRYNISYLDKIGMAVKSESGRNRNNIQFYNNTIYDSSLYGVLLFKTSGQFKNNIVWCPNASGNVYRIASSATTGSWLSDYNNIGPERHAFIKYSDDTLYDSLSQFITATSNDMHSISSHPCFTDVSLYDFYLQSDSPCIEAGINVGLFRDYLDTSVPQSSNPDIGALEYIYSKILSPPKNLRIE